MINDHLSIPLREFDFTFSRSGGPGGQNVNKVNSRVSLRWNVRKTEALPPAVLNRFVERFHRRITQDGELLIHSQRFRDQGRNVADCLDRLRQMVLEIAIAPKTRRPTKPTRASKRRRLQNKRHRSQKKGGRQRPSMDD